MPLADLRSCPEESEQIQVVSGAAGGGMTISHGATLKCRLLICGVVKKSAKQKRILLFRAFIFT